MSKYIVKNCPARCFQEYCEECQMYCQIKTDCLTKQVIDKCKNIECPCEFNGADCWECRTSGQKTLADTILQLFEIEECE